MQELAAAASDAAKSWAAASERPAKAAGSVDAGTLAAAASAKRKLQGALNLVAPLLKQLQDCNEAVA